MFDLAGKSHNKLIVVVLLAIAVLVCVMLLSIRTNNDQELVTPLTSHSLRSATKDLTEDNHKDRFSVSIVEASVPMKEESDTNDDPYDWISSLVNITPFEGKKVSEIERVASIEDTFGYPIPEPGELQPEETTQLAQALWQCSHYLNNPENNKEIQRRLKEMHVDYVPTDYQSICGRLTVQESYRAEEYLLNAAERGEPNARLLLSIEETVIFNGNYQTFDELEFDPNPAAQQHLFERKALQDKYLDQFIADGYIFGHYFKAIEVGNPVIVLMG